jgi:uncharacterized protein (DUF362 family)
MTELSRKNFIRFLAASLGSLGSLYLSGCLNQNKLLSRGFSPEKISPTPFIPDPTQTQNLTTLEPTPTETSIPSPTPAPADLVVARNGKEEEMVRAAVKGLGGMGQFVKPGDVVVVKPNICVAYYSYEYAATTNPWVVGAIVKLALEAGAKTVKVMDYPFGDPSGGEQAYYKSGIQEQVQKAGGKMVLMSGIKFVKTDIPGGKVLKSARIFDDVLRADVLINVPIIKDHGLAILTLAMKNLMGVIYDRPSMHSNLGQRLADLSTRVRSHLVIVDGVRMLMKKGPSGGDLSYVRRANTIIASPDIVAADSYAATVFGIQPDRLGYINKGAEMGLGVKDLSSLRIEEISLG